MLRKGILAAAGAAALGLLSAGPSFSAPVQRAAPGRTIWARGTRRGYKVHKWRPEKPLAPRAKLSLGQSYAGNGTGRRVYKTVGRRIKQIG